MKLIFFFFFFFDDFTLSPLGVPPAVRWILCNTIYSQLSAEHLCNELLDSPVVEFLLNYTFVV